MPIDQTTTDTLFQAASGMQAPMSNLAQMALSSGANLSLKGDNAGAVREFRRAISLDPSKDNAVNAYKLMAAAYVQDNKPDDAIKAYQQSLRIDPANDETHVGLGNIYFSQQRYEDALKEYSAAVATNPTSAADVLSLGQAYLATGRYADAESRFQQVTRMTPDQYGGYYALGQTYAKEGKADAAIPQFEKVIAMKHDFYNAYVDLGSAYADLGKSDKAQEQLTVLQNQAPDLASVLSGYISKVSHPKLLAAFSTSGFLNALGPGTAVSSLDPSLATAGASKLFTMSFVFDKQMDVSSVQNAMNWSIAKAAYGAPGGAYDWGISPPANDAQLSPIPVAVQYDASANTALVSFSIQQNASADAVLDPSHLTFTFNGKDSYGNAMDPSADQYNAISMIV
jgi:tetratricopeptide (TPR) repeat protein